MCEATVQHLQLKTSTVRCIFLHKRAIFVDLFAKLDNGKKLFYFIILAFLACMACCLTTPDQKEISIYKPKVAF